MNTRHVTISSNESTANNYRPSQHDQQSSQNTLKITLPNQKSGKEQCKPRNNKNNDPENQKRTNTGMRDIKELSSKHLQALKHTFNRTIQEQILSIEDRKQYLSIFNQLQKLIVDQRPGAQVILYGSPLFECALKEKSMIDIDVQFNNTLPYDTLKELLHIIRDWDLCKKVHLNIDNEPLSVDVTMPNSDILVRLTSNNISGIQLSRLIQIYTKFDHRVLPLLRLFRIFSNICHLDQPDEGTLHPIALHIMAIHFLQQIDPPVLPCLHEYVFGVDKAPVTCIKDQYVEFFQICQEYVSRWKSTNQTSVEMLFLQLLSYFVRRFHPKRLEISILTRMPLLRPNKKLAHNRSLFCANPIYMNRNIAYSLKAGCLLNYFYHTLETALYYFCQTPSSETENGNLFYTINDYDENVLRKQLVETIHKSYNLFIDHFSNRNDFWNNVQQEDLRKQYKQTFDPVKNPMPEPVLKLKESNIIELFDNDDEEEDEDENTEEISPENTVEQLPQSFPSQEEDQEKVVLEKKLDQESQEGEEPVLFNTLAEQLDEKQKLLLRKQYDEQVRLFNNKMQQLLIEIKSTTSQTNSSVSTSSINQNEQIDSLDPKLTSNPWDLFYDMHAKNFDADQNLPIVCSICFRTTHKESNCPELSLPRLIQIPKLNQQWTDLITRICQHITDQCKPSEQDTENRKEIVEYLRNEFGKCYPSSCVHIYGSSQNGFGFRQSDLDICMELKDNNEESNVMIFEKLLQNLQLKTDIFQDTEFIRDARIPIIRSRHSQFNIEIDISLNNILGVENTRLLKTYTQIDPRVSQLGYMIKHLVKTCGIADVRTGTLSSYAYILMLIHFLQQIRPSVLPVLQQLHNDSTEKKTMIYEWNIYFYDDLTKLKQAWINKTGLNKLTTGELWIEFLRYYTERFDYKNHIVTIRQIEPLRRDEKGWFNPTIAIEDPFILTHNLADKLRLKKWKMIHRVFIRAREGFGLQPQGIDIQRVQIEWMQDYLFDIEFLCPAKTQQFFKAIRKPKKKQNEKSSPDVIKKDNSELLSKTTKTYQNREFHRKTSGKL